MGTPMTDEEARHAIDSMRAFIEIEAKEEAAQIENKAKNENMIDTEKYVSEAKLRIKKQYEDKLEKYNVQKKIERSGASNHARIKRMASRNRFIEQILGESLHQMGIYFKSHKDKYHDLIKHSIVQCLIKLMEARVNLRCKKTDVGEIKKILPGAIKEYVNLLKTEIPRFHGREIKCNVTIDENNYLPEYHSKDTGLPSCVGGIELTAREGKIVCTNTLDTRIELCFHEALPEVRGLLFPSQKAVNKFDTESSTKRAAEELKGLKVHFFDAHGRGEGIRMMLWHAGVEFEDVRVQLEDWSALKASGKFEFGCMPVIELPTQDHKMLGQMLAIFRYLGKKLGYYPKDKDVAYKVDSMMEAAQDIIISYSTFFHNQEEESKKVALLKFREALPTFFRVCDERIKKNSSKKYMVGNSLTTIDFMMLGLVYSIFAQEKLQDFFEEEFKKVPLIKQYLDGLTKEMKAFIKEMPRRPI